MYAVNGTQLTWTHDRTAGRDRHMCCCLHQQTLRVQPQYLIALLAEYLRSLQRNYIPAQQALHELLAELLAAEERLVELYQLPQYRVSSDSPVLALRLLEIGAGIGIRQISQQRQWIASISRASRAVQKVRKKEMRRRQSLGSR